jgi:preprotein translocase subunit SecB
MTKKSQLYNKLIELIELTNIELHHFECNKNIDFENDGCPIGIAINYKISEVQQKDIQVRIPSKFVLIAYRKDSEEEPEINSIVKEDIAFKIEFEFILIYTLLVNEETKQHTYKFSDDLFKQFADKNAVINAWPYARELISNSTVKMGFPPLFIPIYKQIPKL